MDKDTVFGEEDFISPHTPVSSLPNPSSSYPQSVFSTLIWLRREQEALALAAQARERARAKLFCTIAKHLRKRGEEPQQILPILTRAQDALAASPGWPEMSVVEWDIVKELASLHDWQRAHDIACAITNPLHRDSALASLALEQLEAGLWKDALETAQLTRKGFHRWRIASAVCQEFVRTHAWDDAHALAEEIEDPDVQITVLSALARELSAASCVTRAHAIGQQAVQIAWGRGNLSGLRNLSRDLASAHLWDLAALVADAITFPLPGTDARAKLDIPEQQREDQMERRSISHHRCESLATLAAEATKAKHALHRETLWKEAWELAISCECILSKAKALSYLTFCFVEASLWEQAEETWAEAGVLWRQIQEKNQGDEVYAIANGYQLLVPWCSKLVSAGRWQQAWKLFCDWDEEKDASGVKIAMGEKIAITLDQCQQHEDAWMVWRRVRDLVLATRSRNLLMGLAEALQQAGRWKEADAVWKVSASTVLEKRYGDKARRSTEYGRYALRLAQNQRPEEAERMLTESMKAARDADPVHWESGLR
jgi:hypothetical protein